MLSGIRSAVSCPRLVPLLLAVLATLPLLPAPLRAQSLPAGQPELPRVFLDTTYAPPPGSIIFVPAGGSFQAALNSAQPGDVIELQAGATFTGNFTLPNKTGTGWIYIRSSAEVSLPPPGTRVTPVHATLMPKIVSPNTSPTLTTAASAHHYRFVGVEITTTHSVTSSTNAGLIMLGATSGQTSLTQVPTDIILDRCYIHGTPTGNVRRGIAMNSARTAVIDSYLGNFHEVGADSQAIVGTNGPGPFKIVNNYLEGAGENVMFGGADPKIADLVPSDIEIRHNHIFKPLSWKVGHPSYTGIHWTVKNLFELKSARRVLIDGNILENNWVDAQVGIAILFTVRNQDGTAPWSTVEDITFTNNILRNSPGAVNILGTDNLQSSQDSKRLLIKNNVFEAIGGTLFQIARRSADVTIDHNTGFHTGRVIMSDIPTEPNTTFVYRNNVTPRGSFGVIGSGTGEGNPTLTTYFPGAVFVKNVLAGGNAAQYPPDNFFPTSLDAVGFVDRLAGNYRLSPSSPYQDAGTDGKDLGADIDALEAATAGVISGSPSFDTTPPAVSITAPASGATISGTTTVSASASDNVGVSGVQFKLDEADLEAEDTVAPYSIAWNTTTAPSGSHVLTATARDVAGNLTTSSAVAVTVMAMTDNTPPVVTAVAATVVTSSGTIITWTTDETSDSQVEYGLTTTYGSLTPFNATLVTSHSQVLSGLSSNTLYHYRVKSRDAAGNLAVSTDQTFTTLAAATRSPFKGVPFAVPGLIEAEDFDNGGEGVAYHDMVPGNAGGRYRLNEDVDIIANGTGYAVNNIQTGEWLSYTINVAQAGTYRIEAAVSSASTTSRWHVEIDGVDKTGSILVPHTGSWSTFQFIGKSGVSLSAGLHILKIYAEQEYFNLDALRLVAEDVTAPTISAVVAAGISSSAATITWATDEAADSQVEYGTTTPYGQTSALDASLVISHSVALSGLSAGTLYHYRVTSRDLTGHLATSADFTFTTAPPPDTTLPTVSITAPTSESTVAGIVTVSAGASDDVGVVGVQFKLDGANLGAEDTTNAYSVSWNTTAAANGLYTLIAVARDAAGNSSTSTAITVTVNNDSIPPVLSALTASSITAAGATIAWTTDEASDSQVEYGTTTAYGQATLVNTSLVTSHSVALSGLSAGTLYHYRVKSKDAAGNRAVSPDQTFTTASTQSPYKGSAFLVPGLIEAEDFDHGGEGVAYHDLTPGNQGGLYRTNVDVDIISPYVNGYVVNYIQTGEWLAYTINVSQAGTYRVEASVSSESTTSRWHIDIDGVNVTGSILVPHTGSWWTFQWIGNGGVSLSAGQHILRISAEQEYFNLDAIRIVAEDVTAPVISNVAAANTTGTSATITWTTNEASDSQVEYGLTSAYGTTTTLDPVRVTAHSQTLSGLSPSTTYHYRVASKDAAGNRAVSPDQTFTTASTQSPYKGSAFLVPGLIEAEDFDHGGEGVAYHDLTPGNQGGLYRTNVDVDIISPYVNGYVVNYIQTGEWLAYTINVSQSGTYRVEASVSSEFTTSRWHVEIDGVNVTGSILVPHTGSWWTFQWIGNGGVSLSAGQHILRISAEQEYFNLDAIRIVAEP